MERLLRDWADAAAQRRRARAPLESAHAIWDVDKKPA
jgi:hypothetical protein